MSYLERLKSYIYPAEQSAEGIENETKVKSFEDGIDESIAEVLLTNEIFNTLGEEEYKEEETNKWKELGFSGVTFNDINELESVTLDNPNGLPIKYIDNETTDINNFDIDNESIDKAVKETGINKSLLSALMAHSDGSVYNQNNVRLNAILLNKFIEQVKEDNDSDDNTLSTYRDALIAFDLGNEYVFNGKRGTNSKQKINADKVSKILSMYLKGNELS